MLLISLLFLFNSPQLPVTPTEPTLTQLLSTTSPTARLDAMSKAVTKYAVQYNVSAKDMLAVLTCENRDYDPKLQSYHKESRSINGREESYGVAQINIRYNPSITYEQATDPDYSLEFMARMFSQGKQHLWSCSRMVLAKK